MAATHWIAVGIGVNALVPYGRIVVLAASTTDWPRKPNGPLSIIPNGVCRCTTTDCCLNS